MSRKNAREVSPLRRSVVVGIVLALLVLASGGALALTTHRSYTAESVLVVLPRADFDQATSAAFFETLSRGQIVGTFAEVTNHQTFLTQALDQLSLTPAERRQVDTTVSVVPDTSVILVRVSAGSRATAEAVADVTARTASTYLASLSDAYRTQVVRSAAGSSAESGLPPLLVVGLAAAVALVLGLAAQQAVYHLLRARRLTIADDPAEIPASPADRAPVRQPQPQPEPV